MASSREPLRVGARVETSLTPPRLSSFPAERAQLEYSSRSLVFRSDGQRLMRSWGPPERPFAVAVREAGSRWDVTGWGVDPPGARRAVREMFSLDDPLEEFYALVRREPVLAGTDRRFRGLRLPRDPSIYEALLHSIIGQQLSVAAANTIKGRLFAAAGCTLRVDGLDLPRAPTPRELTRLGHDGLRGVGLSEAKTSAILTLAVRQRAGAFSPEVFQRLGPEAAVDRLDAEPGVGRWTAENALLRGAARRDMFVAGDLGIRVALAAYGTLRREAPEEEARQWGDRHYPGWGSYATLYLWRRWVADGTPRAAPPKVKTASTNSRKGRSSPRSSAARRSG
jgi:DNA-3-methyladenine glycosylase II